MRKILMATTALVGVALAGSAQAAATSPISLDVGGYTDFLGGLYHESTDLPAGVKQDGHDFETEFKLNFDALGKASNGIEYGANVSLWNGPDVSNAWTGGGTGVTVDSAYVWLSGAFGKALFGDEHGASDLFVYAPTVGEGQIDGAYMDFVSPFTLARFQPSGIDNTEHSTKVTYYTPKVGNENNKVQLGLSYIPNMYDSGDNVIKYETPTGLGNSIANSPYQDVVKGAAQYTGNFNPVNVTLSAQILEGLASSDVMSATTVGSGLSAAAIPGSGIFAKKAADFVAYGFGGQVGYQGFTVGGSYMSDGRYDTIHAQNREQNNFTLGGKYEFDKVAIAANWITASGYDDMLVGGSTATGFANTDYVKDFNAYGLGATYTWFPGLTTGLDAIFFTQDRQDPTKADENAGHVLLVSQKLTF